MTIGNQQRETPQLATYKRSKVFSDLLNAVIYLLGLCLSFFSVNDARNKNFFYLLDSAEFDSQRVIQSGKNIFDATHICFTYAYILFQNQLRITLSFFLKLCDENKFEQSVKVFSLNIKSINPMQKYPHIFDSWICILKIFFTILLLPINLFISSEMCSARKLSKYGTFTYLHTFYLHTELSNVDLCSSRFIT